MSISRDLSKFIAPSGQLEYDNTTSGLSATTIKSAIDELNTLLGGGNVGSQATFNVYEFTATASQTTFSLSSNHGQGSDITAGNFVDGTTYIITSVGTTDFVTLYGASSNTVGVTFTANTNPGTGTGTAKVVADYIPGFIKVYLNGVLLSETDYVASDGDNVVLDVGADVGALLSVVVLDSFNTATQLRVLGIDAGAPDNSVTVDASGNLDVAGTVTADGLTVETNTTSAVTISEDTGSGVAELRFIATEAFPKTKIVTDVSAASLTLETLGSDRLKIANNGDISFYEATGTTAKLFWDASAESLGIGTLTPAELLHIESGTNGEQVDIRFRGLTTSAGAGRSANIGFDPDPNDTGTSSEAQLYLSADTTNKTLVATASGNVGIGTTSPLTKLNVEGGSFLLRGGTIDIGPTAGTDGAARISSSLANTVEGTLILSTQNSSAVMTERMRIDSSGNVGIGTASPEALLSLSKTTAGGEGGYIYIDNPATSTLNSKSGIKFGTSSGASFASIPTGEITNVVTDAGSGASALTFGTFNGTASGERMRIDSSGHVLINNTAFSSLGTLVVKQTADSKGIAIIDDTESNTFFIENNGDETKFRGNTTSPITFSHSTGEVMRIDASGNLLVGTTSTINSGLGVFSKANSNQLVINSSNSNGGSLDFCNGGASASARIGGLTTGTATALQVQVGATGGVQLASGATSWTSMSDERLKDIIEPISDAVSKLLTLRTVIGKYKVDAPQVRRVFVIAQDVEKVLPEAVSKSTVSLDDPEEFLGVAYSELIPLLIAGFKEQQATIETLEARIAALES